MKPIIRDRLGSVVMLAFIAALWVQRDYTSPYGGLFPDRIMAVMGFFALLTLILSFTRYGAPHVDGNAKKAPKTEAEGGRGLNLIVVIGILMLWVLLFRYLGFALTFILGFASIAWCVNGQWSDWKVFAKALIPAVIIAFVVYMVFDYMLLVPLPPGAIFG